MTILDLIKRTARIFNVEEILSDPDLSTITSITQSTVLDNNEQLNCVFELSKIVLSEVYSYLAKEMEVTASSVDCVIDKKSLGSVAKIVSIKNNYGKVNYQLKNNEIILEQDGEYVVKYIVAPDFKYLNNEIDMLNGDISEDLLINGLNAYYCLTAGLFEEYNVYNGRYIDGISRLRNPKLFAMPCRSWHE